MKITRLVLVFAVVLGFCSCEAVQESAGKAFDNAGSVIRTGEQKAYVRSGSTSSKKQSTADSAPEVRESDYQRY